MGGRGSHPLGWTALALVVVAYAHVILVLAGAGLALAIAVRILTAAPGRVLVDRVMARQDRRERSGRDATATTRPTTRFVAKRARGRSVRRAGLGRQEGRAGADHAVRARSPGRITARKGGARCVS